MWKHFWRDGILGLSMILAFDLTLIGWSGAAVEKEPTVQPYFCFYIGGSVVCYDLCYLLGYC